MLLLGWWSSKLEEGTMLPLKSTLRGALSKYNNTTKQRTHEYELYSDYGFVIFVQKISNKMKKSSKFQKI